MIVARVKYLHQEMANTKHYYLKQPYEIDSKALLQVSRYLYVERNLEEIANLPKQI